jgi:hypothetical protein
MSSHADMERTVEIMALKDERNALLAENQQLREALQEAIDLARLDYLSAKEHDRLDRLELEAVVEECVCGEINTRHCPVHGQGAAVEE